MALRLVSEVSDTKSHVPVDLSDPDAAICLAEFHQQIAGEMPLDSDLRGLVLRASFHWAEIAAARATVAQAT